MLLSLGFCRGHNFFPLNSIRGLISQGPFTAEAPGGHGPGYQAGTGERAAEPAGPPEKIIGRKRRLIEAWQREQQM